MDATAALTSEAPSGLLVRVSHRLDDVLHSRGNKRPQHGGTGTKTTGAQPIAQSTRRTSTDLSGGSGEKAGSATAPVLMTLNKTLERRAGSSSMLADKPATPLSLSKSLGSPASPRRSTAPPEGAAFTVLKLREHWKEMRAYMDQVTSLCSELGSSAGVTRDSGAVVPRGSYRERGSYTAPAVAFDPHGDGGGDGEDAKMEGDGGLGWSAIRATLSADAEDSDDDAAFVTQLEREAAQLLREADAELMRSDFHFRLASPSTVGGGDEQAAGGDDYLQRVSERLAALGIDEDSGSEITSDDRERVDSPNAGGSELSHAEHTGEASVADTSALRQPPSEGHFDGEATGELAELLLSEAKLRDAAAWEGVSQRIHERYTERRARIAEGRQLCDTLLSKYAVATGRDGGRLATPCSTPKAVTALASADALPRPPLRVSSEAVEELPRGGRRSYVQVLSLLPPTPAHHVAASTVTAEDGGGGSGHANDSGVQSNFVTYHRAVLDSIHELAVRDMERDGVISDSPVQNSVPRTAKEAFVREEASNLTPITDFPTEESIAGAPVAAAPVGLPPPPPTERMAFGNFLDRIDTLLPTAVACAALDDVEKLGKAGNGVTPKRQPVRRDPREMTVEEIKRAAVRAQVLLSTQHSEARQMQQEDFVATRREEELLSLELLAQQKREREQLWLWEECFNCFAALVLEECERAEVIRRLALRAWEALVRVRVGHACRVGAFTIHVERLPRDEAEKRSLVVNDEAVAWCNLVDRGAASRHEAAARELQCLRTALASARDRHTEQSIARVTQSLAQLVGSAPGLALVDGLGVQRRAQVLMDQAVELQRWRLCGATGSYAATVEGVENCIRRALAETRNAREERTKARSAQEVGTWRLVTSPLRAGEEESGGGRGPNAWTVAGGPVELTALTAKRFLPPITAEAPLAFEDAHHVWLLYHSLEVTLEDVHAIDISGLAAMQTYVSDGGARHSGTSAVAHDTQRPCRSTALLPFVSELDLSNNNIEAISLKELLYRAPALRSIKLRGNRLRRLSVEAVENSPRTHEKSPRRCSPLQVTADGDQPTFTEAELDRQRRRSSVFSASLRAASSFAVAQAQCVSELDVAANQLVTLNEVGSLLPGLRVLSAFGNALETLEPLAEATNTVVDRSAPLVTLELSRNRLRSLAGLRHAHVLHTLDVSSNESLASIQPLVEDGANCLLHALYASRNSIAALPTTLPRGPERAPHPAVPLVFLRELVLSHNHLVTFPDSFSWLPFLTLLDVECNRITSVAGVARCPRLVTLKLGFNALSDLAALAPVLGCKALDTLSINDNPFFDLLSDTARNTDEDPSCDRLEAATSKAALLNLLSLSLPFLRTVNNEVLADALARERGSRTTSWEASPEKEVLMQWAALQEHLASSAEGRFLRSTAAASGWWVDAAPPSVHVYRHHLHHLVQLRRRYLDPSPDATAHGEALAIHEALSHIQAEYAALSVDIRCRVHARQALLELPASEPGCGWNPPESEQQDARPAVKHSLLHCAAQRAHRMACEESYVEGLQLTLMQLKRLHALSAADAGGASPCASAARHVHMTHSQYTIRSQIHREREARGKLSRWLRYRILLRRIRRSLRLFEQQAAEQRYLVESRASAVLQGVCRGYAARQRCRRALQLKHSDAAEVDQFATVALDLPQLPLTLKEVVVDVLATRRQNPTSSLNVAPPPPLPSAEPASPRSPQQVGGANGRAGSGTQCATRPGDRGRSPVADVAPTPSKPMVESSDLERQWLREGAQSSKRKAQKSKARQQEAGGPYSRARR